MKVRQFVCLQSECEHYSAGHLIDGTTLVGNVDRMENLTSAKAEAIVGVIRAIFNEEIHRQGSYVGLNIFQDENFPTRVNYGRSYGNLFDEFGNTQTAHFLEFEDNATATAYVAVLQGILMLGLTRFRVNAERFVYDGGKTQELPVITDGLVQSDFVSNPQIREYTAFDYFFRD